MLTMVHIAQCMYLSPFILSYICVFCLEIISKFHWSVDDNWSFYLHLEKLCKCYVQWCKVWKLLIVTTSTWNNFFISCAKEVQWTADCHVNKGNMKINIYTAVKMNLHSQHMCFALRYILVRYYFFNIIAHWIFLCLAVQYAVATELTTPGISLGVLCVRRNATVQAYL